MARWLPSIFPVAFALACSAEPAPEELTVEGLVEECTSTVECLEDACSDEREAAAIAGAEVSACEAACPELDDECDAACIAMSEDESEALRACTLDSCLIGYTADDLVQDDLCINSTTLGPPEDLQPKCGHLLGVRTFYLDADYCGEELFSPWAD